MLLLREGLAWAAAAFLVAMLITDCAMLALVYASARFRPLPCFVDLDFDLVGEDSGADSQENERGVRPRREIYYGGRISLRNARNFRRKDATSEPSRPSRGGKNGIEGVLLDDLGQEGRILFDPG